MSCGMTQSATLTTSACFFPHFVSVASYNVYKRHPPACCLVLGLVGCFSSRASYDADGRTRDYFRKYYVWIFRLGFDSFLGLDFDGLDGFYLIQCSKAEFSLDDFLGGGYDQQDFNCRTRASIYVGDSGCEGSWISLVYYSYVRLFYRLGSVCAILSGD